MRGAPRPHSRTPSLEDASPPQLTAWACMHAPRAPFFGSLWQVRLRDAALSRHSVARVLSSPPPFPTFLPEDQDASAEEGGSTEPVSLSRGV